MSAVNNGKTLASSMVIGILESFAILILSSVDDTYTAMRNIVAVAIGVFLCVLAVYETKELCIEYYTGVGKMKVGVDTIQSAPEEGYVALINIETVDDTCKVPTRGSSEAAGYDLYAHLDIDEIAVAPHTTMKIGTGIKMEIPSGFFGALFARSGLASKKGLRPANAVGVIDADYRGEIIVALHNDTDEYQTIQNNERIAQIVIMPFLPVEFNKVDSLTKTDRGDGGFGSTGVK